MCDDLSHRPDHVGGGGLLPQLSVDPGGVAQRLRIRDQRGGRNGRPQGGELVERLGVAELAAADVAGLEVTRRHVVSRRVPEHIVERLRLGHVLAVPAHDDGQLAFVVEFGLSVPVHVDGVEGTCEGVGRFGENYGIGRDGKLIPQKEREGKMSVSKRLEMML